MKLNTDQKPAVIRSVFRAANILICLGSGINSITDIAKQCNLSSSTVHRLLKALEELSLVSYDPFRHRYYMGSLIARLSANPQVTHNDLIMCVNKDMRNLWDISGENVELNIMVGIQYILLHEYQSKYNIRVFEGDDPVGSVYVGASAKVLLSQLCDKELREALKGIEIRKVTEHSITDRRQLITQIKEIRQQGYGISYGERIPGALCVSVPVKSYFWPLALSVVGPESRLKPRLEETLKVVMAKASTISGNIAEYFHEKEVRDMV